jgi:hypothetical protein
VATGNLARLAFQPTTRRFRASCANSVNLGLLAPSIRTGVLGRALKHSELAKGSLACQHPRLLSPSDFTLLLRTANSPSPILARSGAIFLFHSIAGFVSPTSHPMVKMAREIATRTKLAGQNARKPFLASHIRKLFELWHQPEGANLHHLMKLVAITLCFVGFLRYSDLMVVQWEELLFFPTHMEVVYKKE